MRFPSRTSSGATTSCNMPCVHSIKLAVNTRANLFSTKTVFRSAYEVYYQGLREWVLDGNYGEIVVPMGHTYNGEPLRKCRDNQWMRWLRGRTSGKTKEKVRESDH